jgi:hypothetical protein
VWAASVDSATNAPIETVEDYPPEAPAIVAAVFVTSLPAGSRLEASWEYNDTSLDAFTTALELPEATARQWITFEIARNDPAEPWPEGRYEIAIAHDGAIVREGTVEVVAPG